MTDDQARTILVQAMQYANVVGLSGELRSAFEKGAADIELDQLDMDSLAVMELCIAIEANTGVSVTPDQLKTAGTGTALVRMMLGQTA